MDKKKQNKLAGQVMRLLKNIYYRFLTTNKGLIKRRFRKRLGREVNLSQPALYNDKIQWLKLNWYDPLGTICADKYRVRKFVKDKIGDQYLNELIAVYNSVEEINLDELPNKFVLKGTHGSGFNIICKDKNKVNWDDQFNEMKTWLKTNYFWPKREWVYKDIQPRIVCEKYLEDSEGELRDYKFFCFDGEPRLIQVNLNRFSNHRRNIYDINWNLLDVEIELPPNKNKKIEKPKGLDEMLELCKVLSKGFPHVRVDFYYVEEQVIFGELTFFHGSGMESIKPLDFELQMGEWIELPNRRNK